jgi:hypothetical protein
MPNRAVITFAPLIFERDHLLVLALLQNFSSDLRPGNERGPVGHVFSVGKHQHLAESRGLARIDIQKIDIERIAFRDAKLPAACLDNCVSHEAERKSRPKFHKWVALTSGKLDLAGVQKGRLSLFGETKPALLRRLTSILSPFPMEEANPLRWSRDYAAALSAAPTSSLYKPS